MRDFGDYLRAYSAYVAASLGWGKALTIALVWLAGMFAPLALKRLVEFPSRVAVTWMIVGRCLATSLRLTKCGNTTALRLQA